MGRFLIIIGTFAFWGIGAFISKIATNKIGVQGVFWYALGYSPIIILYSLMFFKLKNILQSAQTSKIGMGLAILAGILSALGMVGVYFLLTRKEVSTITPLTALYPVLTVILAFIFLRENITLAKLIGIFLSLIAIYLLSK